MNIWSWPSRLQTIIADLSPQPGNSSHTDLHVYLPIVLDRPQSKTWWLECWFMNLLHTIKIHMIRKSVHRNRTRVWFKTSRMSLEWPSKEDEWSFHCPIHYIFYSTPCNNLSSNTHDSNKPVISLKYPNIAWFWVNSVLFYLVSGKTDCLICMVLKSLKSPKATCSSVQRKMYLLMFRVVIQIRPPRPNLQNNL